jgi:transposase
MSCIDMRTLASCFKLPENMAITSVYPTELAMIISLSCSASTACCPLCHQPSERVHGTYQHTVADVPCGERQVRLMLTVRKFICHTSDCLHSIFTERLPKLVQSYARMTNRLREWIEVIGRAVSGERDKAAVLAGLTLPHSNGVVEGKVHKLKYLKRIGYGRAGFALLRQRVLHAL